jgi:predicted Rossmann fold nucleotide-binding protein DprA/Smf involved in DNA uptake
MALGNRTREAELRDADQIWALREMFGDDHLVHSIASTYRTWSELAAAPEAHLANLLGHRLVPIPTLPPEKPFLPPAVRVVTRYSDELPLALRQASNPPVMLFATGTIPSEPMLAVIGAENPTMAGAEIAKSAGLSAATLKVPLVVPLQPGCSLWAARTNLDAGGRVVAVLGHGFGVTSTQQLLLEQIVATGGAVLTPFSPGSPGNEHTLDHAGRIAAAAAAAVVLAEVGLHKSAGAAATTAAVAAGKFLIVPEVQAAPESGRYIAPTAMGSALFTSAREWTDAPFGTNSRIEQRTVNGLSPADAVVTDHLELTSAIKNACAER